jgi:hypothetical protein
MRRGTPLATCIGRRSGRAPRPPANARDVLLRLWEADRADRAVRKAIEELLSEEPPDWFVAALSKRIDGFTGGQVRAALERLRVRLEVPPPIPTPEPPGPLPPDPGARARPSTRRLPERLDDCSAV